MKEKLQYILRNTNLLNINEIFHLFEKTEDVLILKYDGIREKNKFTIIIIGKESRFETINIEIDDLQSGLRMVLVKYQSYII